MDSYGMVYAARGVGKSWFCMARAVAIAEGRQRFLPWDLNGQHTVLYIDGEMTTADLKERFSELCRAPLHNLFIMPSEKLYRDGSPICQDEVTMTVHHLLVVDCELSRTTVRSELLDCMAPCSCPSAQV